MTRKIVPTPAVPPADRPTLKIPTPVSVDVLPPWHAAHDEQINAMIVSHVDMINARRQALEDQRSIHRNRNRFATLLGAFLISIVITYVLTSGTLGAAGKTFGPYSFAITILLDSSFTLYAYLKRY